MGMLFALMVAFSGQVVADEVALSERMANGHEASVSTLPGEVLDEVVLDAVYGKGCHWQAPPTDVDLAVILWDENKYKAHASGAQVEVVNHGSGNVQTQRTVFSH